MADDCAEFFEIEKCVSRLYGLESPFDKADVFDERTRPLRPFQFCADARALKILPHGGHMRIEGFLPAKVPGRSTQNLSNPHRKTRRA